MRLYPKIWERWKAARWKRFFTATARRLVPALMLLIAFGFSAGLTYDRQAYIRLDAGTHTWSGWGGPLYGLDLTQARANVFTLVRDLRRTVTIVDHGTVDRSIMMDVMNYVSRGEVRTVADALEWFDIPLTTRQADAINLCQSLTDLWTDQAIIIQPDPWQYGVASWYGPGFQGRLAASGEIYDMHALTAAHRTLPLQSMVRVVSQQTGKDVVVRINDRGPYVDSRIIDLSRAAMDELGGVDLAAVYLERLDSTALDNPCRR
ncbi:MAG TPA: septal ring lytic transglycosylase RlpA family protein [Candidatus Paceibacterota bacterium]|nr:septal ring lytic transglycosylase RlpA family protein [Candidatus Paceibacterota bacterium]